MKAIVTGGAGFLGVHLCRALAKAGHEVKVIDLVENPEFPTTIADIRDAELMMTHINNADAVFHLAGLIQAGESVQKPHEYVESNIDGTINVLEAMAKNNVPTIIFSSSAAVYGEPLKIPIEEDTRYLPLSPYGMTKLAMESLTNCYVGSHQLNGVALRYFNLYGPEERHQPETHAIPRFISQINAGEEVTVWGNGEHQRDYIYISDVVDAHLLAWEYAINNPAKYHYFNISTEKPSTTLDIVQQIEKQLGKKANIKHFPARPGDPMVLFASATKAKNELKWQAKVDIQLGLKQTIEYFLSSLEVHGQEKTIE